MNNKQPTPNPDSYLGKLQSDPKYQALLDDARISLKAELNQQTRYRIERVMEQVWKHKHGADCEFTCPSATMALDEIESLVKEEIASAEQALNKRLNEEFEKRMNREIAVAQRQLLHDFRAIYRIENLPTDGRKPVTTVEEWIDRRLAVLSRK